MSPVGFRTRLFLILTLFATLPSIALTLVWGGTFARALPLVSGSSAWERAAATGGKAISAAQQAPLSASDRAALRAHELELQESLTQARRFGFLAQRAVPVMALIALVALGVLIVVSSRVAGHLSRQLSRPIDELVGWTDRLGRGEELPDAVLRKGAPEFAVLRSRMRSVARELREARAREIEAERLRAFRESARQVAHELKNPLTPIRFAVARLRREAPDALSDAVEVLDVESRRLEDMARSFSQFGRLPEGPPADVDVAELVRYTTRVSVPPGVEADVRIADDVPMVRGHHDALARALSNVLLNAVDACRSGAADNRSGTARIGVTVARETHNGDDGVVIAVRDTGCGIAPERLATIWEPYVTNKPGGTGLGLAIARQTVLAHNGTVQATSSVGTGTEIRFILPTAGIDATEAVSADSR
ncbi:MAG TPA: HAMP domain-containing sensor histidine kinase [Gemmatimonadaceae bacterium]|nr:HAMP domain-containing sensor histidine kinase [Gemmatimonadaceae bacterium]